MNTSILKRNAISLSELNKDTTDDERKFIDAEKKYYKIVIALKKKREELGFTQEKLSFLSNIPRTTITKVESGSRNATLHTLISMAQAMGKNIEFRLY